MPKTPAGKLQRVILATDFTPGARNALTRAVRLPLARRATLTVVHVLPRTGSAGLSAQAGSIAATALDRVAANARQLLADQDLRAVHVEALLVRGSAGPQLARSAKKLRAELVVLGKHGLRGFTNLFIGSTARRLIRAGSVPVLVVQRRAARVYARPLVAVELDGSARHALQTVRRCISGKRTTVMVLHATPRPFDFPMKMVGTSDTEVSRYRKRAVRDARATMRRMLAGVRSQHIRWRPVVEHGDARDLILSTAKRGRTDLIVMGSHGRGAMARVAIGSVAEDVLQNAPCDVLVARLRKLR